jgi:rhomboid protease GluP
MARLDKNSMLCPNCRKLISSDEPSCPYCGITNPGSRWKKGLSRLSLRDPSDIITILLYTNAALFILSIVLNPSSVGLSANPLMFFAPSNKSLLLLGATGTFPIDHFHRWWTLVSATYLHGGILHIFFNMIALRQLGPFVLSEYGLNRFFIIYTLTGIVGFFISYLAGVPFTIGASASVCGLIGGTLYYGKSRGGFYGEALFKQVMGWVIGLALFGFFVPGINNWAHGGGIAAGIALGFLLGYHEKTRENLFHRMIFAACVLLTVVVLGWAVLQALYLRFLYHPGM